MNNDNIDLNDIFDGFEDDEKFFEMLDKLANDKEDSNE